MIPVYMEVTQDKYEFPVKVADSIAELAELCGVKYGYIKRIIADYRSGKVKNPKYIVVFIPEE